jgi:hypothetical protein
MRGCSIHKRTEPKIAHCACILTAHTPLVCHNHAHLPASSMLLAAEPDNELARAAVVRLPPLVEVQREKLKNEMLGRLHVSHGTFFVRAQRNAGLCVCV